VSGHDYEILPSVSACRIFKNKHVNTPQSDTAILLFAHTAGEEVRYKTLSKGQGVGVNKKLAGTLLQYTLDVATDSGIPLLPIFSEQQVGNTFGERLANAFQDVFAAGYQQVICIGSDCPTLTAAELMLAQEELSRVNMVVGPATDGGAYLIGLHIDSFDPENFAMLNWQTNELLNDLMLYSYRQNSCMGCLRLLQEKGDVNNQKDLAAQIELLPVYHTLRRQITAILRRSDSVGYTLIGPSLKPAPEQTLSIVLRAPPVL
jgi:uncharacterized protein